MGLRVYADSEGPDQGLYCPLTDLLYTTECMNEEQRLTRILCDLMISLRKHAYSNILKILPQKKKIKIFR